MEMLPVCIAAFFQLLGISFFICQPADQCSPAPSLASWLSLLAGLCLLSDIKVCSFNYTHVSWHLQMAVDIVAGIFLIEIFTLIIWCGIERMVFLLTREIIYAVGLANCCSTCVEYALQGVTTGAASCALLKFAMQATDTVYRVNHYIKKTRCNSLKFWRTACTVYGMNKCERQRTLRLAKTRWGCRKRQYCPEDEEDDDEEEEEW